MCTSIQVDYVSCAGTWSILSAFVWVQLVVVELTNDYEKIGSTKVDISDLLKSEAITEPYDDTKTYDVGDYVTYLGYLYKCKTAVTTAQSFAPAKWDKIDVFTYMKMMVLIILQMKKHIMHYLQIIKL